MQADVTQISVYGLGTLGSNLLLQMARTLPGRRFTGYDFDRVEAKNLANQAYFREHIGLPKVKAMQVLLARLQGVSFTPVDRRVDSLYRPGPGELWLDLFDNQESRALFPAGDFSILHVGLSPDGVGEVIWNKDYSAPGQVNPNAPDICTNPAMMAFTQVVIGIALQKIVDFIATGSRQSCIVRRLGASVNVMQL